MNEFKCPFCGSDKLKIETPYIKPVTHESEWRYCCIAQAKNQEYIKKKYHPIYSDEVDPDDIAKW